MDLLGQRQALKGHGIITDTSAVGRQQFVRDMAPIIVPIIKLQERTATMKRTLETNPPSPLRSLLAKDAQLEWAEIRKMRLCTQYWSDGLVAFTSLGEHTIKCRMNSVFSIFGMAGTECLAGLCSRAPIRGAIDIAWGVELRPGELYGAAVANAYELESSCAQYPRMLVSEQTIDFLKATIQRPENDNFAEYDRRLAQICCDMVLKDGDGRYILHYLGDTFRDAITKAQHATFYEAARSFVSTEYERFRRATDTKLELRYRALLSYFEKFPPKP